MPEAKRAREAEFCYATVAMVTDHDHITLDATVKVLLAGAEKGRALVKAVAPRLATREGSCRAGCHTALESAIITRPEAHDPAVVRSVDAVAGRVPHDG